MKWAEDNELTNENLKVLLFSRNANHGIIINE